MFYLYIALGIIFLGFCSVFVYIQNYGLQKTKYNLTFDNLPESFNGTKVLHLTDIHRKSFGKDQNKIISMIREEKPDLIVVSGDIIYCYNHWYNFGYSYEKDLKKVMKIFDSLSKEYPIYYTPGNHECKSGYYPYIREALLDSGVTVLDSDIKTLEKNGEKISIIGLKDPTFWGGSNIVLDEYINKTHLELTNLKEKVNGFTLLISHRPEIFDVYRQAEVDVVFTGHAHGGQWIFPLVGPVFAPQQGYFPKYTSGVHTFGKTKVIISRGLGNSSMPLRLFNRPEIVIATLSK
ncbi:MAG: metallophosphoesterase [Ruminococcaceae bacterium]|nr:metallophosphoesterase [Oscillospiraceae bacterium]